MGQIVVGYDGSESGDAGLDKGIELAERLGDGLVVVFGYDPPGPLGGEMSDHREAVSEVPVLVVPTPDAVDPG
jgi:nucleotide-binding universal stress UspA family protein